MLILSNLYGIYFYRYLLTAMIYSTKLTATQANYLQSLLPKQYSMQEVTLDSKRQRSVRKLDEIFVADYEVPVKKTPVKMQKVASQQKSEQKAESQEDNESIENPMLKVEPYMEKKADSSKIKESSNKKKDLNAQFLSKLLQKLKSNRCSGPFRIPVDPIAQGVPNYLDIVKHPMDLRTIDRKLKNGEYLTDQEVHSDIRQIISNSYLFNQNEPAYLAVTKDFEALYLKLSKKGQKNVDENFSPAKKQIDVQFSASPQKKRKGKEQKKTSNSIILPQTQKIEAPITSKPSTKMAQNMNFRERQKLFHQIYQLPQKDIIALLKIIDNSTLSKNWNEIQIDFKDLDDDKFRKIVNLVKERS